MFQDTVGRSARVHSAASVKASKTRNGLRNQGTLQQVPEYRFLQGRFLFTLTRRHGERCLVSIHQLVVTSVLLYVILLKVSEPTDDTA